MVKNIRLKQKSSSDYFHIIQVYGTAKRARQRLKIQIHLLYLTVTSMHSINPGSQSLSKDSWDTDLWSESTILFYLLRSGFSLVGERRKKRLHVEKEKNKLENSNPDWEHLGSFLCWGRACTLLHILDDNKPYWGHGLYLNMSVLIHVQFT